MVWLRARVNDIDEFSRWDPNDTTGWIEVAIDSQEHQDYIASIEQSEINRELKSVKYQKIDMKMRLDAGLALGMDMSEEQTEFNKL